MTRHRVPAEVQNAIQLANAANWKVSIRNEKVMITAPDGVNLTIGLNPNQESLKKFMREIPAYNLIEGPARTPAETKALLKRAEEEGKKQAEAANRKRAEFEAAQAKKKAEAEAAAKKAAAATVNGLKTVAKPKVETKPEAKIPTQTTTSAKDSIFPAFDKSLIGSMDYPKFQLSDGRFYCIECWSEGIEFTARKPQGLATHRGFRHQMYAGTTASTDTSIQETRRVILPGDIQDALDLLGTVIAENLAPVEDTGKIAELTAALAEVKKQAALDLDKADADYQALKDSSDEALKAAKEKIHQLTGELTGKDGQQQAEIEALLKNFRELLGQVHKAINEMSPIQAIAKIDELVAPYLKG